MLLGHFHLVPSVPPFNHVPMLHTFMYMYLYSLLSPVPMYCQADSSMEGQPAPPLPQPDLYSGTAAADSQS